MSKMNFFIRAFISIKRKLDKTIILVFLIITLASFTAGAILVRNAVNLAEMSIIRSIPPFVLIDLDHDWINENWADVNFYDLEERWSRELISLITELPYVSDLIYTNQYAGHFDLYLYEPIEGFIPSVRGTFAGASTIGISVTEPILMQHGMMELVEGRVFTEAEISSGNLMGVTPALISRSFAEINNLNVDSIISYFNILLSVPPELLDDKGIEELESLSALTFDLEIIGIYDFNYEHFGTEPHLFNQIPLTEIMDLGAALNTVYVPTWFNHEVIHYSHETIMDVLGEERLQVWGDIRGLGDTIEPVIILHDSLYLEAFKLAAEPLLPENLMFRDLSLIRYDALSSMETLSWIADIVLIGAIVATILVLSLLITLFLRDRRHEIGIYMALGERKLKIISQILIEVFVVSVFGITAALFIGNAMSSQISQSML